MYDRLFAAGGGMGAEPVDDVTLRERVAATHMLSEPCSKGQRRSSLMPWAKRQHLSNGHILPRLYVLHVTCGLHVTLARRPCSGN